MGAIPENIFDDMPDLESQGWRVDGTKLVNIYSLEVIDLTDPFELKTLEWRMKIGSGGGGGSDPEPDPEDPFNMSDLEIINQHTNTTTPAVKDYGEEFNEIQSGNGSGPESNSNGAPNRPTRPEPPTKKPITGYLVAAALALFLDM